MSEVYGLYRGSVHDVNDPENRGRLRVLVPSALGDAPSAWAEPVLPVTDTIAWRVEDRVWVQFENGDVNRPVYQSRMAVGYDDLTTEIINLVAAPVLPPTTTTLTVQGTVDTFILGTDPQASTDEVILHMSRVQGFIPDSSTQLPGTPTRATVLPVTTEPSGTPLDQTLTYFFRAVTINALGEVATGEEVSASLDPTKVDDLMLATLRAGGVEFGKMKVGPGSWDPDVGITIPQSDGQETLISSNPNIASRWAGQVVGTFVTIMQGIITGLLEVLGNVRLSKGVSAPRTGLGVTETWATRTLATPGIANTRNGLATGIDPTTWATLNYDSQKIEIYSKSTGALISSLSMTLQSPIRSALWLTVSGGQYWILTRHPKFLDYSVTTLNSAGVEPAGASYGLLVHQDDIAKGFMVLNAGPPGELVIAFPLSGTTKVAVRRYSAPSSGVTNNISGIFVEMGFTTVLGAVALDAFDYGLGNRILVFPTGSAPKGFSPSGVRDSTIDFPPAFDARINGIAWSNGQFHSLDNTNLVRSYGTNRIARDLGFAHAWASEDGTLVTQAPVVTRLVQRARASALVTAQPPPEAGQAGAAKANRVAIYVGENFFYRQVILPAGVNSTVLGVTADSNGPERSSSNGFVSVASTGRLTSEAVKAADGLPVIDLRGDGLWWLGPLRGNATQRFDPHPRGGLANVPVSGTNPTTGSLRVEFGFTYPTPPAVALGPQSFSPDNFRASVAGVDTTGFTLYATRINGGATAIPVNWIAVPV